MSGRLHVDIAPIQPAPGLQVVSVAAIAFMYAGRPHVTAVAKVALEMRPGARMTFGPPPPIRERDAVDPRTRAVLFPNDLHPVLGCADVTFVGHAYAPSSAGVSSMLTRLALVRPREMGGPLEGGAALMDKTLQIVGARVATASQPNPPPTPFVSMPISYALALGGPDDDANPVGIGRTVDANGACEYPCILSPQAGARGPIGYGPIDASWPTRQRLVVRRRIAGPQTEPDADDVQPTFFHAAPIDQRVDFLRGDEWIFLEGLHPRCPVMQTQLPRLMGRGRIYIGDDLARPLVMRADALHIQGDIACCTLGYRGTFAIERERDLAELRLCAGVEMADQLPAWPSFPSPRRRERTLVLERSSESRTGGALTAPPLADERTVQLEIAVLPSEFEDEGTLTLDVDAAPATSERFDHMPRNAVDPQSSVEPRPAIPGAPWSSEPLAPAPDARRAERVAGTLVIEPPAAPPPKEAPPVEVRPPTKVEWRVDRSPDPGAQAPAVPPRRPEIGRPTVDKSRLYQKFKR